MQGGAAGRQHLQRGATCEQRGDQRAHRGDELLTVVEDEQDLRGPELHDDAVDELRIAARHHPQGRGHDGRKHQGVADLRQIHEAGSLGELPRDLPGNGQRQPRLAHPAGAGQGQQGHGLIEQEGTRRRLFHRPADGTGAGAREGGGLNRGSSDHQTIRSGCRTRAWRRTPRRVWLALRSMLLAQGEVVIRRKYATSYPGGSMWRLEALTPSPSPFLLAQGEGSRSAWAGPGPGAPRPGLTC